MEIEGGWTCLSSSSLSLSSLHKPSSHSSCWPCIEDGIRAGSADSLVAGSASVLSKLRASRARLTRARVSSTLALAPLSCMPGSSIGVNWPGGPVMEIEGCSTPAASTSDWRDSQSSVAWCDSQSSVITSGWRDSGCIRVSGCGEAERDESMRSVLRACSGLGSGWGLGVACRMWHISETCRKAWNPTIQYSAARLTSITCWYLWSETTPESLPDADRATNDARETALLMVTSRFRPRSAWCWKNRARGSLWRGSLRAAFLKCRKTPTRPPPAIHTEQPHASPARTSGLATEQSLVQPALSANGR